MAEPKRPRPFRADACCPKCGHDKVRSIYEGPLEDDPCWYDRKYSPPNYWPVKEFLRRICDRCGFEWPEAVLRAGVKAAQPKDPNNG